jgi:hypothetical protein
MQILDKSSSSGSVEIIGNVCSGYHEGIMKATINAIIAPPENL